MPNIPRSCVQYRNTSFRCFYVLQSIIMLIYEEAPNNISNEIAFVQLLIGRVSCPVARREGRFMRRVTGRDGRCRREQIAPCVSRVGSRPRARRRRVPHRATRRRHEMATNEHGARFIHTINLTGHAESEKKLAHCMIMLFVCFFWKYIKR